jgi:hypothetical protein
MKPCRNDKHQIQKCLKVLWRLEEGRYLNVKKYTGTIIFYLFIYLFIFLFFYSYMHTRLGSFLPPCPHPLPYHPLCPSLSPPPPQYPAETILPLFLILL